MACPARLHRAPQVHYSEPVLRTAAAAVAEIGAYRYIAAHLRRNDFQYRQAGEVGELAAKFLAKLKPGEALYIATDEVDPAYVEAFKYVGRGLLNPFGEGGLGCTRALRGLRTR